MVVRKAPVRFAKKRRHLRSQPSEGGHRNQAPYPVATVRDHSNRTLESIPADDPFTITLKNRAIRCFLSSARAPALGHDDLPELEDLLAVKRLASEHHLEAVELGRIVRSGDLEPGIGAERGDREVEGRRGESAHTHGGAARLDDPCPHTLR